MLPISWNGSNGVVHFLVTAARKSLTVWACAPVVTSASAHSAAASFFMIASLGFLSFRSQITSQPAPQATPATAEFFALPDGITRYVAGNWLAGNAAQ